MTSQAIQPSRSQLAQKGRPLPHSLARFLTWLLRPHPSIADAKTQRRSQLLAGMMVTTAIISTTLLFLTTATVNFSNLDAIDTQIAIFGAAIIYVPIFLNRAGRVRLAARLFIGLMTLVFLAVPYTTGVLPEIAYFNILPLLLTAIFFSTRATMILAGILAVATAALGLTFTSVTWPFVVSFFILLAGALIALFMRQVQYEEGLRTGELRHANEKLRASEETLEQRVVERTEQLERANRVKSAFLASMSHELRTPLNAIINFTKFVAKGSMGPVNDEQKGALNEVIDSAKHLLSLINDVLDMSKIESGSLKLFVEKVDLNGVMKSLLATGKTLIGEKTIELRAEVDPDLPSILGDKQRIYQVLLNILSNACKFTEEGQITVSAHRIGENVEFAIKDTGPGIVAEDHELVFKAFQQTNTGLRQAGGTGLGMPISRSLAEAHGGRLWLESELGKGATFYVSLPVQSSLLQPTVAIQ